MISPLREILREHFAKPDFLDFRGEAEQNAGIAVTALDFSNLCGDEEGTSAGHALARKKPPAAMNDIADERSCATAHGHLIRKTSQHAFGDIRVIGRCILKKQSLGVGYVEELLKKLSHLPCGVGVDAKSAAFVHSKIPRSRPLKDTHENKEIGGATTENFSTLVLYFFIHPQQHRAGLRESGNERR
jgi:hypothetical protein